MQWSHLLVFLYAFLYICLSVYFLFRSAELRKREIQSHEIGRNIVYNLLCSICFFHMSLFPTLFPYPIIIKPQVEATLLFYLDLDILFK